MPPQCEVNTAGPAFFRDLELNMRVYLGEHEQLAERLQEAESVVEL